MVTVEMSHVQREQTARPLGPDTHLLKCDVIIQSDPPPTMLPRLVRLVRDDRVSHTIL